MKAKVKLFQDSGGKSFCLGISSQNENPYVLPHFIDLQTIRPDPTLYLKKGRTYDCNIEMCGKKKCPKSIKIGEKKFLCK